jgi:glucose/arabinose dehydrogenase
VSSSAADPWPVIRLEPWAAGLSYVTEIGNAGDGSNRLFVLEQPGTIRVVTPGRQVLGAPFLDIHARVGSAGAEQGLLGLAFSRTYASDGLFYVDYTDLNGDTVVSRFHVSVDLNRADAASETVVFTVDQPFANHNGGHLAFGPDGLLYIGMGDGGGGGDPNGNAQRDSTLLGKLLRLDVSAPGARPQVYAKGLRNPWKYSWDAATGELYIADVGQNAWEEVDMLPAGALPGANFGWNVMEGLHCYKPPGGCATTGFDRPVFEYNHSDGCSITGGYVYRGAANLAMAGIYFLSDYCSGVITGLRRGSGGAWESNPVFATHFLVSTFGLGEDGEQFVAKYASPGGIFHVTAESPLPPLSNHRFAPGVARD